MGCALSVSSTLNIMLKGAVNKYHSFLESIPLVFKETYDFGPLQTGLVCLGKKTTYLHHTK